MSIDKIHKTILFVEDDAVITLREAEMLEKYGYRVITVHCAEKAIERPAIKPSTFSSWIAISDGERWKGRMLLSVFLSATMFFGALNC
ncbi:MAG: hypothetical protein ACLFRY_08980 [Spirochaetia bacterium]